MASASGASSYTHLFLLLLLLLLLFMSSISSKVAMNHVGSSFSSPLTILLLAIYPNWAIFVFLILFLMGMGMLEFCRRQQARQWRRWNRCRGWNRCCSMDRGGGWMASGYVPSALAVEVPGASACLPLAAMPSTAIYPTGLSASAPWHPRLVTALDAISKPKCPPPKLYYLFALISHWSLRWEASIVKKRISVLISLFIGIGFIIYESAALHRGLLTWFILNGPFYIGLQIILH